MGKQHGYSKIKPVLQIDLIKQITNKMSEIPLVLHGASGVDDKQLALAIAAGICKVNIETDLKMAYAQSLKDSFKKTMNYLIQEFLVKLLLMLCNL